MDENKELEALINQVYGPSRRASKKWSPSLETEARIFARIKPAEYNRELGLVTHMLTEAEAEEYMHPAQKMLAASYLSGVVAYTDDAADEKAARIRANWGKSIIPADSPEVWHPKTPGSRIVVRKGETLEGYLQQEVEAKRWSRLEKQGYVLKEPWSEPLTLSSGSTLPGGSAYAQKPHGYKGCKGIALFAGPYHIRCSQCDCEVRYWEWGVDYDTG